MNQVLEAHIIQQYGRILDIQPLSGGDISAVHRIQTSNTDLVIKTGEGPTFKTLLEAEYSGLKQLNQHNVIAIPEVYEMNTVDQISFLVMAYIPTKQPSSEDMTRLGQNLANLHQCQSSYFGGDSSNFIGTLPQYNPPTVQWAEFYTNQRLTPQLNWAISNGYLTPSQCPSAAEMIDLMTRLASEVKPVCLHGDLWSGNYLIHENGTPYLIDPATYYGHATVDIAMTKLFGGFSAEFYQGYSQEIGSTAAPDPALIDLYQLYYYLVHLNLFGQSYRYDVNSILQAYF